jgi:hypothetical protein
MESPLAGKTGIPNYILISQMESFDTMNEEGSTELIGISIPTRDLEGMRKAVERLSTARCRKLALRIGRIAEEGSTGRDYEDRKPLWGPLDTLWRFSAAKLFPAEDSLTGVSLGPRNRSNTTDMNMLQYRTPKSSVVMYGVGQCKSCFSQSQENSRDTSPRTSWILGTLPCLMVVGWDDRKACLSCRARGIQEQCAPSDHWRLLNMKR